MYGACSEHLDELIDDFLEENHHPPNLTIAEKGQAACKYCAQPALYLVTICG